MALVPKNRERAAFGLAWCMAVVSVLAVLIIGGFQIYVRWSFNQNFTFLGGGELEVITAGAFALVIALAYLYRAKL